MRMRSVEKMMKFPQMGSLETMLTSRLRIAYNRGSLSLESKNGNIKHPRELAPMVLDYRSNSEFSGNFSCCNTRNTSFEASHDS